MQAELSLEKGRPIGVTPYDLLGYLVPGGFLVTCLAGYEGLLKHYAPGVTLHTPVHSAVSYLLRAGPRDSWATDTVALATFVAIVYVAGHVVASISALLVDRVYLAKAHGYPFRRLLGFETEETYATLFYRAIFYWINLYLLFRFLGLPRGEALDLTLPAPFSSILPTVFVAPNFLRAANVVGWILVGLIAAKLTLSATRTSKPGVGEWMASTPPGRIVVGALERALAILAWPALFVTHFVGTPLDARRSLDQATCDAFKSRIAQIVGFSEKSPGDKAAFLSSTSAYWACAIHIRASSPELEVAADNWLRLYSFARNLATAFYVAFLYCLVLWINLPSTIQFDPIGAKSTLFAFPIVLFVFSFVLLLRYYYLYAGYYSKYLIRAVVYLAHRESVK